VGNLVADFVKGRQLYGYAPGIQKGVLLHRAIDAFTDAHDATKALKAFFRPQYRLYAGAFADVVYDHFLANDSAAFENEGALQRFATDTYATLDAQLALLPPAFARMVPYMRQQNWLYGYRFAAGVAQSFNGLVRRAAYLTESAIAHQLFLEHHAAMGDCYAAFFPDLKKFSVLQLEQLLAT
jgi:acyl carrier protein phosphodiesterase